MIVANVTMCTKIRQKLEHKLTFGPGTAPMRAVLWDMDGTLVDSEKRWDVSLAALYDRHPVSPARLRESAFSGRISASM